MSHSKHITIIAKRDAAGNTDTAEIRTLAAVADHEIVGELTQQRPEDTTYNLGRGATERLADRIESREADVVVFDNDLTPQQAHSIRELVPDGTRIIDRYRLILDIFEEQAGTRRAQLQVQLAELRYERPRVRARIRLETEAANERRARGGLGEKEDRRITDMKQRIQRIERELEAIDSTATARREHRREAGLSLIALAGYTNAGKSTLLRRLADDLTVDAESHTNLAETVGVEDRPFKTLGTTTRRATLDGRAVLLTDTIGFIRDLPSWLIQSFESTLAALSHADIVCAVVDGSDPVEEIKAKVTTARTHLKERTRVLPVINKTDLATDSRIEAACTAVQAFDLSPAVISATEGTGIGELCARLHDTLPEERERFVLPNTGETMAFISWAYDHAAVESVAYDGNTVAIELVGHPSIVHQATGRAEELT